MESHGLWLFAGLVTNDFVLSSVFTPRGSGAGLAAILAARRWRILAVPVVAAYLVTAGAAGRTWPCRSRTKSRNIGTKQYAIPADTNLGRYTAVVIWCRAFSVRFGDAVLRRA